MEPADRSPFGTSDAVDSAAHDGSDDLHPAVRKSALLKRNLCHFCRFGPSQYKPKYQSPRFFTGELKEY
jgi:hypothetical protein